MHVPHVTCPAEVHAVRVVYFVELFWGLLLDLVSAGPDPGHIPCFDELESTREVISIVVSVRWIHDVTGQHDQIRTLRVQYCLNNALRLEVVL